MSTTDVLTITSAPDALTRYYHAKEREESAVLYINDAYLEAVDALEKLEAENAKLRESRAEMYQCAKAYSFENAKLRELLADVFRDFVCCDIALREHGRTYLAYTRYIDRMRELGVEAKA